MPTGAPDGVLMIQVAVTVKNVPVVPSTNVEVAAGGVGRYSGGDTTYQTVVSWTVATDKVGELKEIVLLTNDYSKTYFKITVGSVTFATDWMMQASMPLIFEDLKLAAAQVVKVEAKSSDATSLIVDAVIVGKEIG